MKALRMVVIIMAFGGLLAGCVLCRLCEKPPTSHVKVTEGPPILFSGTVMSNFGKPIQDAVVQVNGAMTKTDKGGTFQLPARIAGKYIVTIRKDGFGLFSHTYRAGVERKTWILTEATVERVDPTRAIRVHDKLSQTGCYGTLSSRVTAEDYERKIPVYGDITPSAKIVLDVIARKTECSPGVVIEIPADSLVDDKNQPPSGPIDVSVSTVDLFAPDGMPGNYGVVLQPRDDDAISVRREGYMDSRGAGFITVTGGGKSYQLKSGRTATLTIPVDPTQLKLVRAQGGELGATIPLLLYDEKQAIWVHEGVAVLNAAKDAYIAQISHFSGYNADLVFSNIGCVKIDTSPLDGNFQWEVSALTPTQGLQYKSEEISRPFSTDLSSTHHAEYRLPAGQDITFKWYQGAVVPADPHQPIQGVTPLGQTTVPALQPQTDQSVPFPVFPYTDCKGSVKFYKDASQAGIPSVKASPSGSGSIVVSWTYDYNGVLDTGWDPLIASNGNDGFQIEESVNGGASFAPVTSDPSFTFNKGLTDRSKSKSTTLARPPGTYRYRVRACYAANPAANQCTTAGVSNDVTVPVPPAATLKIKNNLVTQSIQGPFADVNVLRVRVASSINTLMDGPDAEKLEVDGFCNVVPSKWISAKANAGDPATERLIDIAGIGGPEYYVYIELGYWKQWSNGIAEPLVDMSPLHSTHQCPSSHSVPPVPPNSPILNARSKHMYGTDGSVAGNLYLYNHRSFGPTSGYLRVTGHTSGQLTLTIGGSAQAPTISSGGTGTVSSSMGLNTIKPPGNDPVTGTIP